MLVKRYFVTEKFGSYFVQGKVEGKVERVNTKVDVERPDAYRIAEFAEMHFDEAPSWCGRGMNEGDKKQS